VFYYLYFRSVIEEQIYRSKQCLIQRKKDNRYGKTLASVTQRLSDQLVEYKYVFCSRTKNYFDKA